MRDGKTRGAREKLPATKREKQEVSVDDVVRQLLELFDLLGVDSSLLADKFKGLRYKSLLSKRLYPHAAAIGELLTTWHQNPLYLDSHGHPLPIRMEGRLKSFRKLATISVPSIKPDKLLTELERVGAVTVNRLGQIEVQMRFLSVYVDHALAKQHTLTLLDNFVKTLRHNLTSPPSNADQLFHRVARNAYFDVTDIPMLKVRIQRSGQNFLESCDNWMDHRAKVRRKSRGPRAQVSVGIYLSVDNEKS